MGKTNRPSSRVALAAIKKGFDKAVEPSTKEIIAKLLKQPARKCTLWRKIGEALYEIPTLDFVNRDGLIKAIGSYIAQNNIGYLELDEALETLEKMGYIEVESSEKNYFLSKEFARAVEVMKVFEEEIVRPIVENAKQNAECKTIKDLDQLVTARLFRAVK